MFGFRPPSSPHMDADPETQSLACPERNAASPPSD